MKFGSRPLLLSSFSVMVALIVISGVMYDRQTQTIFVEIDRIQQEYQGSERLLLEVRSDTNEIAVLVRDYLLESEHDESLRQGIHDLERSINSNLDDLQQSPGLAGDVTVALLKEDLALYLESIEPIFDWTPQERALRGTVFLRRNVVPFRQKVLSVTRDLEALISANLSEQRTAHSKLQDDSRRFLSLTVFLTAASAVLVAVLSIRRLSALERHALVLQRKTEQDSREMRHLSQKMVRAQEEERRSLSRELHDEIGQMLTGIQMEFNNLRTLRSIDDKGFEEHFESGKTLVERTLSAVRDMARGLRPSMLDDFGLAPALEWQSREFSRRSGIPVQLQIDGIFDDLSEEVRICLYRVAQEGLTNSARHAGASDIRITLNRGPQIIVLTVQDNGKGFDHNEQSKGRLGLLGIEERVRELGGNVSIISQPQKGALLRVEIPAGSKQV